MEFREKLHRRMPRSLAAPSRIREALCPLEHDVGGDTLATLQLLTSELVTNVVTHTHSSAMEVSVAMGAGRVRVEVRNDERGFQPREIDEDLSSTTGRGLLLVDRLADRWGVGDAYGTRIWYELKIAKRSGGERESAGEGLSVLS